MGHHVSEATTGLYGLLRSPWIYELVQTIFGAEKDRTIFARDHIGARSGDRVLDIGCGPGELVRYLPAITYVGYEPNLAYIERANIRFPNAEFHAKLFEESDLPRHAPFDIAILSAVLHHMNDDEAMTLFRMLKRALKPGGRVVSQDPVFIPDQNPIARFLISIDRGRNVRTPDDYCRLARSAFVNCYGKLMHRSLPPYTRWIMTAQ